MARQEIILGTPPQGLGGDPPRTASMKINAMTQEVYAALGAVDSALPPALPVAKGGTGGATPAAARAALELGTAATAAIGTAAGNVMPVGAGGWLGKSIVDNVNIDNVRPTGLYSHAGALNAPYGALSMLSSDWGENPVWQSQLALGVSANKAYFRSIRKDFTALTPWAEIYHTGNTTRAADGTLKAI